MLLALIASEAIAHEYWIAPTDFTVQPGERIDARLLVGQMMQGTELPWLSHNFRSFRISTPRGVRDVRGTEGDLPAFSMVAEEPGLHVIAHETLPLLVTFDTLAEFREYLAYEGLGVIEELHRRRGLPETGITEAYVRSAKSLIQVGPAQPGDGDRRMGLPFELVALANPFAGGDILPVRLLWHGQPQPNALISVFRQNGDVERSVVFTDAAGRADIALSAGARYLLNSVHIEPADDEDHVWESTWASITFASPPDD